MSLTPTTPNVLAMLNTLAESRMQLPESVHLQTEHIIHGGMYSRTIRLEADVEIIGCLIKVPTLLIVVGHCVVFVGDRWIELQGTHIIPASAGRKQVFVTIEPTSITAIFATDAMTVEQAEAEFTDERDWLLSRRHDGSDIITVTGE